MDSNPATPSFLSRSWSRALAWASPPPTSSAAATQLGKKRKSITPPLEARRYSQKLQCVDDEDDEEGLVLRRPSKRRHTVASAEDLDGPEQLHRNGTHSTASSASWSTTAPTPPWTPTRGGDGGSDGSSSLVEHFLTPIKQFMPHGRAFVSALFSVYGDMDAQGPADLAAAPSSSFTTTTTTTTTTSSSSSVPSPPTPPPLRSSSARRTASVPASVIGAPPSPPSDSTSPSSPPDTDSSQYTYIDLTADDDEGYHDADKSRKETEDESEEAAAAGDEEWMKQEALEEEEESSEEAAQRLEHERAVAEQEWREGPLTAALREAASPSGASRSRAPDLLYDMRRFEEREAFRGTLHRRDRRDSSTTRHNRSLSTSTSTSTSTSILDSIVEERFLRSPPPDLRRHGRHRLEETLTEESESDVLSAEEEEDHLTTTTRTTLRPDRLFWISLAKCESRKRVHDYHYADRLEAIDRSHTALENTQSAFARAFIELRVEEKRRRLEKARVKWLSEDRRPFTPEEQALVSRILRGRAAEVMVTGFNAELTRQDLQRLRDTEWLNDEVINFYLNLLKQRSDDRSKNANAKQKPGANEEAWPRVHFLNTFFYPLLSDKGSYNYSRVQKWTRRVDLFAMDRVVVPIHMGNHWCLAVINLQDRRFEYYDSLGSSNRECLQRLRRYLQDEARDKKKIELDLSEWEDYQPKDIPLQKNGYDCGVFACKFAECVASGRPFYFSQVDMPTYRKRMMVGIVNKNLV